MKISQLGNTIRFAIENNKRILMTGPPGVGKTSIFEQTCRDYFKGIDIMIKGYNEEDRENGIDHVIFHPAISDPTEPKGLPFLNKEGTSASFIPYGHLDRLTKSTRKVQVLLDDFPQAPVSVQASFMSLLDKFKDNEFVNFFIAGNRQADFAGANGILEPIKSRMDSIIKVDTSLDDYVNYGIRTGMPPSILAFLRFKPQMLQSDTLTRDLVNTYCPRTITAVGSWINDGLYISTADFSKAEAKSILADNKKGNVIKQTHAFEIISGAVGDGWAIEYIAFERLRQTMPDINKILVDPKNVSVPTDVAVLFSLVGGLASRIVPENSKDKNYKKIIKSNFTNALTYIDKIEKEFQVFFVKDTFNYFPDHNLEKIDQFHKWSQDNHNVLI